MQQKTAGRYIISWRGTKKGSHKLHITIDGQHVHGSPVAVQVLAAELAPDRCEIVRNAGPVEAGRTTVLCVNCVDRYGNLTSPDPLVSFGVTMMRWDTERRLTSTLHSPWRR